MQLTKARRAYLVVRKGEAASPGRLFSSPAHIKTAYKWHLKSGTFVNDYDIIEFELAELGRILGRDFLTVFPDKKRQAR